MSYIPLYISWPGSDHSVCKVTGFQQETMGHALSEMSAGANSIENRMVVFNHSETIITKTGPLVRILGNIDLHEFQGRREGGLRKFTTPSSLIPCRQQRL